MKKLYPLKFKPIWKPKAWGGEFWDLCGFEDDASLVSDGFLAENDLPDILETYMGDLVGDEVFDWHNLYFPLLIKRLIVEDRLSVQVHPDDTVAAERFDDFGKTEFWYVLEAGPDARIYMGFKEDCDAGTLYKACKEGRAQELLNAYVPKPGDCFFIPTGTVHAACGQLKMSEIQEASDLTFRLYDWGREFNPTTRRAIHLDEALDCIDYKKYDEAACCCHLEGLRKAPAGAPADGGVRVLVNDPHFVITSLGLTTPARIKLEDFKSCIVLICVEGSATVVADGNNPCSLTAGETLLIPASLDTVQVVPAEGGAHLLQVHLPQPPKDDVYDGPEPDVP
ncbi:MAG: class I mannose-6-phosphate isomerase [Bacteroidales bacterium]|nr:class I mannose-6-phosphate isomerase [Bacteroidales bacterium]